jgi:hypothetical protein
MGRRLSTWKRFLTIAAAAAVMALPGIAGAAEPAANSWLGEDGSGGDGFWSVSSNWSFGSVPAKAKPSCLVERAPLHILTKHSTLPRPAVPERSSITRQER